jgi:uncharacterized protein (TIGR03437 family)
LSSTPLASSFAPIFYWPVTPQIHEGVFVVSKYRASLLVLFALAPALSAAPRLSLNQTAFTVSVAQGSNGTAQTADATNLGDGSLTLQASSSVTWLAPVVGQQTSCGVAGMCIPIQIALNTSALTNGTYTGTVTVSDPSAVDAPQFITVTVQVGGDVPSSLQFYVPPGGSATSDFITASQVGTKLSANTPWLAVAVNGSGSFEFNVPYQVTVSASKTMPATSYNGSITTSGSSFAPDNKTISVQLTVTTQPILQPSSSSLQFQIAQGANKQTVPLTLTNIGQGTLSVNGATASTTTGGNWLSAAVVSGVVNVTADPTGLDPGVYQGSLVVGSNAANSPTINVQLTVETPVAPVAYAGGVVNNGTFVSGLNLAQGDIVAVFGDQFTYSDPQQASSLPLNTTLDQTQVLVNGVAAPVYYVSPGQVNFEIPIDAATGPGTVQVVRNSQSGNLVYVNIQSRASSFILLNGGPYVIMTTQAGVLTGIPSHPVQAGDVVTVYVIGLGPTTPPVASGSASPVSPLAKITDTTQVCIGVESPFSQPVCTKASFTGLTPNFVGLYQVNFTVPAGLTPADIPFYFTVGGASSDVEQIAVQ